MIILTNYMIIHLRIPFLAKQQAMAVHHEALRCPAEWPGEKRKSSVFVGDPCARIGV